MSLVGFVLAALIDLAVPLGLTIWIARGNYRRRQTNRGEVVFWGLLIVYLGFLASWVARAIVDVPRFDGSSVLPAGVFSLPMSIIPAVFNSLTMSKLFTPGEWLDFGYFIVLPTYLVGLLAWATVLPVAIRAMAGIERVNREARMARDAFPQRAA